MARSFAPGLLIALAVLTAALLLSFAVGRYPAPGSGTSSISSPRNSADMRPTLR
jgi:hypothetical protein